MFKICFPSIDQIISLQECIHTKKIVKALWDAQLYFCHYLHTHYEALTVYTASSYKFDCRDSITTPLILDCCSSYISLLDFKDKSIVYSTYERWIWFVQVAPGANWKLNVNFRNFTPGISRHSVLDLPSCISPWVPWLSNFFVAQAGSVNLVTITFFTSSAGDLSSKHSVFVTALLN